MVVELPARVKSSTVSAWAARGRIEAEASSTKVKRDLLTEWSLREFLLGSGCASFERGVKEILRCENFWFVEV